MKVDLNVTTTSDVRRMSCCGKVSTVNCGIGYRGD